MHCDPRGGHNRKTINTNFFKIWTPSMSYVLGLIVADGTLIDARKSSRTCYFAISNNDKVLLEKVREFMASNHNIYTRQERMVHFKFKKKSYLCKENHILRIGNKKMFLDLLNLGITPRKSLDMKLPHIPNNLFSFFLRGYLDGDGSIISKVPAGQTAPRVSTVFTSGSSIFLNLLSEKLHLLARVSKQRIHKNYEYYQLRYSKNDSLVLLSYIYKYLNSAPYMKRKYNIYKSIR